jgi:alpha-methylacyl-CoA racemase
VYECGDGGWLAVGAIEPRFYANLCRALGCEQWIDHQNDDAVQEDIRTAFRAAFATRPRDAWVTTLGPADTCVSAVASVPELVHDEHFRARDVFVTASRDDGGDFEQVGWLLAGANRAQPTPRVLAAHATHTDELLRAAGIDDAALAELHEAGVIA